MKNLFVIILCLINFFQSHAQCPTDVIISWQNEADSFDDICPDSIFTGNLKIRNFDTDLLNLNGLSHLTQIKGELSVEMSQFTNLNGLSNIRKCDRLVIDQFSGAAISYIALGKIDSLREGLVLEGLRLSTVNFLDNLQFVGENLRITDSDMVDYSKLPNIEDLKFLKIEKSKIVDFSTFPSIKKLHILRIEWNEDLIGFDGLDLDTISFLSIKGNQKLKSLSGIDKLHFADEPSETGLTIIGNHQLVDIKALENVTGKINSNFTIFSNHKLEMCSYPIICERIKTAEKILIDKNKMGCNSVDEINENCSIVQTETVDNSRVFFPNPVSSYLQTNYADWNSVQIYNSVGMSMPIIVIDENRIDVSNYPNGLYFILENYIKVGTFVKN